MTVFNSKDLDKAMEQRISPDQIPKHIGASQGVMQKAIHVQSDHIEVQTGHGRRGSGVYDPNELPPTGYFGGTVVSVNEAPPVEAALDPTAPKPASDGAATLAKVMASFQPKK